MSLWAVIFQYCKPHKFEKCTEKEHENTNACHHFILTKFWSFGKEHTIFKKGYQIIGK